MSYWKEYRKLYIKGKTRAYRKQTVIKTQNPMGTEEAKYKKILKQLTPRAKIP